MKAQSTDSPTPRIKKNSHEENAHRYTAVMTSLDAGIIIKDKAGRITDWSAGAQNIMGYTREEMLGHTSDIYTYRPNLQKIADLNQRVAKGEHTSFIRTDVHHKDGRQIICSTSFSPIFDGNSKIIGSVVIFHDVTAETLEKQRREDMEAALQRSHADTAAILREIPAPICVIAEDGLVLSCNDAFASMCATSVPHILQQPITHFFCSEDPAAPPLSVVQIIPQSCDAPSFTCRLRKADKSFDSIEIMGRPLSFQNQQAYAIHCIDLTERQRNEQALRDAATAAEEASKLKSTFLANMSHEIRTPLNGVVGFAELALDAKDLSPALRDYLQKIKISAHSLLEIINDILDISKIEAGKIDLEKSPFDLRDDILLPAETIISEKAKEKNVTLYLYSEPLVTTKFIGDQTRLRQILLNLLSNAVKFTNVGIVKLMLSVDEHPDNTSTVFFEIKDSGIGMTPEQIQRIFEPFAQADNSTTRKFGGTGLGLSITRNLIELMGGSLKVESALGIGSKFSFALNFETIPDTRKAVPLPQAANARTKPQFKSRVLVCEDNVINQQVIEEHLRRVGISVDIMPNGKLGLEHLKRTLQFGESFDLIFMDIHMPVMDGLEATQKILELNTHIPIVALTANAMATDRKEYLSHGMVDYLAKPFKATDLWDCLLRHLKPMEVQSSLTQTKPAAPTQHVPNATDKPQAVNSPFPAYALVDRVTGFENAAGNATLYQRLLTNFLEDNSTFHAELSQALDSDNLTQAHRMVHTLKSVAATIGATELANMAAEMEGALSASKMDVVRLILPSFGLTLDAVLREVNTLGGKAPHRAPSTECDKEEILKLLEILDPMLRHANSECLEYLDAVNTTILPVGPKGALLAQQIADYDFDLALATAEDIKTSLEDPHV